MSASGPPARESAFSALGDRAWVGRLPRGVDVRALFARLRALPYVEDVVITEERVAIYGVVDLEAAEAALIAAKSAEQASAPTTHVIRVCYDGEDLAEVARVGTMSVAEVIARHTQSTYDVKMIGFLPGFAYLGSLAEGLRMPRRTAPRVRVPAGAVGIAAHYTGIYPFASSGGWNLIGRTVDFAVWEPKNGATLALGDRVRFEAAT